MSDTKPTTTKKHDEFVGEPMQDKPVTKLAGIGDVLGGKLQAAGFGKAYRVLGQYLILEKNKESFQKWMNETCGASSHLSSQCYNCLHAWCEQHMN